MQVYRNNEKIYENKINLKSKIIREDLNKIIFSEIIDFENDTIIDK